MNGWMNLASSTLYSAHITWSQRRWQADTPIFTHLRYYYTTNVVYWRVEGEIGGGVSLTWPGILSCIGFVVEMWINYFITRSFTTAYQTISVSTFGNKHRRLSKCSGHIFRCVDCSIFFNCLYSPSVSFILVFSLSSYYSSLYLSSVIFSLDLFEWFFGAPL